MGRKRKKKSKMEVLVVGFLAVPKLEWVGRVGANASVYPATITNRSLSIGHQTSPGRPRNKLFTLVNAVMSSQSVAKAAGGLVSITKVRSSKLSS